MRILDYTYGRLICLIDHSGGVYVIRNCWRGYQFWQGETAGGVQYGDVVEDADDAAFDEDDIVDGAVDDNMWMLMMMLMILCGC